MPLSQDGMPHNPNNRLLLRVLSGQRHTNLSKRQFVASMTLLTTFGMILAGGLAYLTLSWQPSIWKLVGIGLILPLIGIATQHFSKNNTIATIGYLLIVSGIGLTTGPLVALYKVTIVIKALLATIGATAILSVIGIIYPKSLEGWGRYFFAGLAGLLFVNLAQVVLIGFGVNSSTLHWPIVDYLAAALFCCYIVYDWNEAIRSGRTYRDALDGATSMFLNMANLFIRLLEIIKDIDDD